MVLKEEPTVAVLFDIFGAVGIKSVTASSSVVAVDEVQLLLPAVFCARTHSRYWVFEARLEKVRLVDVVVGDDENK